MRIDVSCKAPCCNDTRVRLDGYCSNWCLETDKWDGQKSLESEFTRIPCDDPIATAAERELEVMWERFFETWLSQPLMSGKLYKLLALLFFLSACAASPDWCPNAVYGAPDGACEWLEPVWQDARSRWSDMGYSLKGCDDPPVVFFEPGPMATTDACCRGANCDLKPGYVVQGCSIEHTITIDRKNDVDTLRAIMFHETMHYLGTCSGVGPDRAHEDDGRWRKYGPLEVI